MDNVYLVKSTLYERITYIYYRNLKNIPYNET